MRGKVKIDISDLKKGRITPAYAGKSTEKQFCDKWYRDHPRLCGEKPMLSIAVFIPPGSPPPMRGKVFDHGKNQFDVGITPAYAGKRRESSDDFFLMKDHPRLCGEKSLPKSKRDSGEGSPPPMRGKDNTGM